MPKLKTVKMEFDARKLEVIGDLLWLDAKRAIREGDLQEADYLKRLAKEFQVQSDTLKVKNPNVNTF